MREADAWELTKRIAFDSVPKMRELIIRYAEAHGSFEVSDIRTALNDPYDRFVSRPLEEMKLLQILNSTKQPGSNAYVYRLTSEIQGMLANV